MWLPGDVLLKHTGGQMKLITYPVDIHNYFYHAAGYAEISNHNTFHISISCLMCGRYELDIDLVANTVTYSMGLLKKIGPLSIIKNDSLGISFRWLEGGDSYIVEMIK